MRSVNSNSFIFGYKFVLFSQEIMKLDSDMKLLLFTKRMKRDCMIYLTPVPCDAADALLREENGLREGE